MQLLFVANFLYDDLLTCIELTHEVELSFVLGRVVQVLRITSGLSRCDALEVGQIVTDQALHRSGYLEIRNFPPHYPVLDRVQGLQVLDVSSLAVFEDFGKVGFCLLLELRSSGEHHVQIERLQLLA